MPAWLTRPTAPWSSRFLDAVVLAYAAFTLCSHAVMLAGGTPRALGWLSFGVALAGTALALARGLRRRRRAAKPEAESPDPAPPRPAPPEPRFESRRLVLLGGAVIALSLVLNHPMLQWFVVTAYLTLCFALTLRAAPQVEPEPRTVPLRQELLVWAFALLCAFLALLAHRYRNDDCYYINLAVTLVDAPDQPLLAQHSIHAPLPGVPRSNAVFPPYRVHSWEALGGTLARLLDLEPIVVIHLGMAAVAAALIPLAFVRLFRLLDPRRSTFMLIAVMGLYLFEGSSGLGFANQGIVRAFTGKSVLLSVLVPLLVHHAIRLAAQPSALAFARLFVAQIAAIGLSSTALWLAPMATMFATALPLPLRLRSFRPIALGLASCSYVVALGLVVRAQMMVKNNPAAHAAAGAALAVRRSGGFKARWDLVGKALEQMFEAPSVAAIFVALLLLAIPLARTALLRRYLALFGFALAALLMNPFVMNFLRHNVTGSYTSQRVMWLAPIPAAVAALFAAIAWLRPAMPPRGRWIVLSSTLALFFALAPTHGVFSKDNEVAFRWPPRSKTPPFAFEVVQRLTEVLQPGAIVLAPEVVSYFLPTVRRHPFPLLTNVKYLSAPPSEDERRKRLVELVSSEHRELAPHETEAIETAVVDYPLDAVVLGRSASKAGAVQPVLRRLGFHRVKAAEGFQLWLSPAAKLRGAER